MECLWGVRRVSVRDAFPRTLTVPKLQGVLEKSWGNPGEFLENSWRTPGEFLENSWRIPGVRPRCVSFVCVLLFCCVSPAASWLRRFLFISGLRLPASPVCFWCVCFVLVGLLVLFFRLCGLLFFVCDFLLEFV